MLHFWDLDEYGCGAERFRLDLRIFHIRIGFKQLCRMYPRVSSGNPPSYKDCIVQFSSSKTNMCTEQGLHDYDQVPIRVIKGPNRKSRLKAVIKRFKNLANIWPF